MLHPELTQALLNIVDNPKKYGVPELNFLFWKYADDKVKSQYLAEFEKDPILRQFNEERYYPPDVAFENLGDLPEGTLGNCYYHHLVDNGLSPNLASGYRAYQEREDAAGKLKDMPDEVKYSTIRGFQMHDIWHPLTGLDTSYLGEAALQAFTLAQFRKPYQAFWMSIITTRIAFIEPRNIEAYMDAITTGWQLGKRAKSLINVHWEELFDQPLDQLRREYNLI